MSTSFKLKPITLAILPLLIAGNTYAAEDSENDNEIDETETIEVTGYRGSLLKSIHDKRNAKTVVDSIFAEDIGKNTDQNIADALSRVTGVSIQTTDGEGTKISVRGAGADLNQISLNGVALTSADPNQAVDLSSFSSDILSSIHVYKTSSADHDEGSLGANVVLKTTKPLNLQNDRLSLEVQGKYNDYNDEFDRKISGSISHKFFDDTFGVIVTASDETQSIRRDEVSGNWLEPYQEVDVRAGGARDLDGNLIEEDTVAILRKSVQYNLNQNQRDRQTINAGFQFIPTDGTDIQLDLSYTKQEVSNDNHSVGISAPNFRTNSDFENLTTGSLGQGVDPVTGEKLTTESGEPLLLPLQDDPQQDWWVVDTENHNLVKSLNRYSGGSFGRSQGGNETENKIATLSIQHYITDNLRMDLTAGYSKTDYTTTPNSRVSTANWGTIPREALANTPLDYLEPVGYDCTQGKCQIVTATKDYIYVPGGVNNNQANIASGGFNPLDPYASHVGYVAKNNNNTLDVNKSVFLDFDWDVDLAGITQFEFGAKVSQRDKDVYTQSQQFQGSGETVFDPETGKPVSGQSTSDIYVADIIDDGTLPVDDFMHGLVGNSSQYDSSFLKGWGLINADKAFSEIFGLENSTLIGDESGSRRTIQDNHSLYFKANFAYLDDRLSGDLGIRYVHTEVSSPFGNSSVKFFSGDRVFTPHELVANGLFDSSNPACTPFSNANQTIRIDGSQKLKSAEELNAQNGTTDAVDQIFDPTPNVVGDKEFGPGETVPNQYQCYDAEIAEVYPNGQPENAVFLDPSEPVPSGYSGRSWWSNYRHADTSTQKRFGNDRNQRLFSSKGDGESDVWLPSLNLNYQINQELIGRFAASKTMARPGFDQLRPGFSYSENIWGEYSRMSAPNSNLQPLISTNLDLSLEWYFNKTGQVSLALYNKDMVDFTETVKERFYTKDLRHDYDLKSINLEDFIINMDEGMTPENSGCMPDRVVQDRLRNSLTFGCEMVEASIIRNGAGVKTRGLEFAYRQNYDFLPGVLSGLGLDFNYTFADSETEAEVLEQSGKLLKALPQAYTPKHTANTAIYWEKHGHLIRLTHRYNSIQLASRGQTNGALWEDARARIDLSANYKVNENVTVSFNALNLTNSDKRTFFTSTSMDLGMRDADGNVIPYDEGNPMEDSGVDTSRTVTQYTTGRQYRLGVRVQF